MTTHRLWHRIFANASFCMHMSVRERTALPNFRWMAEKTASTLLLLW
jgi:hypothetical protein